MSMKFYRNDELRLNFQFVPRSEHIPSQLWKLAKLLIFNKEIISLSAKNLPNIREHCVSRNKFRVYKLVVHILTNSL